MKKMKLLLVTVIMTALSGNLFAQTNLIYNPGFEDGTIPSNPSGIYDNKATHWSELGFSYFYTNGDPNPSTNGCMSGSSDLLDKRSINCQVGVPKNDWGNLNERTTGNRYVSMAGGNWMDIPSTYPPRYRYHSGETVSGKFEGSLQYGCSYNISFWAANATKMNSNCLSTSPNLPPVGSYNKVDVILRKSSTTAANCKDYIVVWTSPNITSTTWTQYSGTFSISQADALKGYDRIDFRLTRFPESERSVKSNSSRRIYLDDVSLTLSTTYTTTPGYSFNNLNVTTATTWNNISAQLLGTTTLNNNLTITTNCMIRMGTDAKIVVKSGKKLTIISSTLEGMCNMWDKIEVENGGEVSITGSNIYDMKNGVRVNGSSSKFTITTSTFDRNYVSVYLFQTNMGSTSSSITSNNFNAKQALKDKTMSISGYGEYGMRVVKCAGTTLIGAITNGGNIFDGSKYGIWIEDSKTDIYNSQFVNHKETGIMCFNGFKYLNTNYIMLGNNRELNVHNNTLRNNKIGIEIRGRSDNTDISNGNKFESNSQYGIQITWARNTQNLNVGEADNNPDRTENIFSNNGIAGVYLYDNAGIQNPSLDLTNIMIGKNSFFDGVNAKGILITEPSKGGTKQFKQLSIQNNYFKSIGNAVRFENIVGNNGTLNIAYGSQQPASSYGFFNETRVFENESNFDSKYNPNSIGFYGLNSSGVQIIKNRADNVTEKQWKNSGIRSDFSEYTLIQQNTTNRTGTGLLANGIVLNSNYLCNNFGKYNAGIYLLNTTLRNSGSVHGKLNTTGNYARENTFNFNTATSSDIYVDNSVVDKNKWIFLTGVATPRIKLVGTSGTIVHPNRGLSGCSAFPNLPPFGTDNEETGGTSKMDAFSNAYRIESYYINNDSSSIGTYSAQVAKILRVEHLYKQGSFSTAKSLIDSISPSNLLDSNYKTVLNVLLDTKPNDTTTIAVDSLGVTRLVEIAQQKVQDGGPAVFLARTILKYEQNLEFDDFDFEIKTISGQLLNTSPCTDSLGLIPISLVDEDGAISSIPPAYVSSSGKFYLDPVALETLDSTKQYGFIIPFPSNYSIKNTEYKDLSDWADDLSIELEIAEAIPSITIDSVSSYSSDSLVVDSYGNSYLATIESDSIYSNILLIKKDSTGGEIWRKYYKGWAGLNDSASIIILDSTTNDVYVGGSTEDSTTINSIVLKYDQDGNLNQVMIYKDSLGSNTKVLGLKKGQGGTLYAECLQNSTLIELTYLSCSEIIDNFVSPEEITIPATTQTIGETPAQSSIVVYPNPTRGQLTIQTEINDGYTFSLYDLFGKTLLVQKISDASTTLSISNFDNGLYIYTITDTKSGNNFFGKVILSK
ncbi:MAG: T9SS type A sorting domain-containing protein [Bacteroidota bacterium]